MTLFLESLRSALASIRAPRLRSFLTSLGIVIGVASVITVVSLIQGLSKSVSDQFSGPGRQRADGQAAQRDEGRHARQDQLPALRRRRPVAGARG
jgi:ABC-type lipoprotein release transport system permease subunit